MAAGSSLVVARSVRTERAGALPDAAPPTLALPHRRSQEAAAVEALRWGGRVHVEFYGEGE